MIWELLLPKMALGFGVCPMNHSHAALHASGVHLDPHRQDSFLAGLSRIQAIDIVQVDSTCAS